MDYDDLAVDYAAHRRVQPEVVGALARRLGPSSRVLEIGCGSGNYLLALHESTGASCWGVDPSEEMLAVARARARARAGAVGLSVGTAERLPYRAESFDLVFSVDVIHHVGDPLRSMHEASRVLVPGGRVCVATEDAEMIRARLHSRYFPETLDVELARYPTVADLRTWLAGAGFAEVREERTVTPVRVVDSSAHRDRAFSSLHLISDAAHRRGLERLDLDLARGPIVWPAEQLLVWAVKPSG